MTDPGIRVRAADPGDADAIRDIWLACLREGAWEGIDEAEVRRQSEEVRVEPDGTLVAEIGGRVVGSITPSLDDLSVAAAFRRRGVGTALVAASLDRVRSAGRPYLLLYVPGGGDPPRPTAARLFAESRGFAYRATLTLMRLDGLDRVPEPALPAGLVVRSFDPADDDVGRYVALMNAAFADHPTPASWDEAVVARIHATPGFDPSGIALVAPTDDPDRPVAFVRTTGGEDDAGCRFGEVRLIGVLPAVRGRGVGRALLRWSIARFRQLGLDRAELAVVVANDAALALYRSEGFRTVVVWPQWSLDAGSGESAEVRQG
jgi:mycothiol synthase